MNIQEAITPIIEKAIEATGGEEIYWDASLILAPTPNGLAPQGILSVMCKSPILGGPPPTSVAMVPTLAMLLDSEITDRLVWDLVANLMEMRSKMLGASIEIPQMDLSGLNL